MDSDLHAEEVPPPELFRPFKGRKFYRKRAAEQVDEDDDVDAPIAPVAASEPMTVDELISQCGQDSSMTPQLSVQEILRQRKAAQRRKAGIEFTNHNAASPAPDTSSELVRRDDTEDEIPEDIKSVISRFAPQTGQVTDETDKHMLAYIDAEIAKMHRQKDQPFKDHPTVPVIGQRNAELQKGRQPAALGRLHEIDLGPDATARNIALTEAAHRRLDGAPEEDEKPCLRRDGKPFRRKRRTSTDIKRDQLVEEVMRESKLEIYDDDDEATEGDGGEGEADDRIAEQFRRDFLDAVSNRRRRIRAPPVKVNGKVVPVEPRGPKLGGSRSARAKVREKELQEAAKGKRR